MEQLKIAIAGGSGFVGSNLARSLTGAGHSVTVFDIYRNPGLCGESIACVEADMNRAGDWQNEIVRNNVIINLAGKPVISRWTRRNRKKIRESRTLTTKNIVDAVLKDKGDVSLFINASAVGYYGATGDELVTENFSSGSGFLADVCKEWERRVYELEETRVRYVITRFGLVLGAGGGLLKKIVPAFKFFMGSPFSNGKQWMSWVHIDDLVRSYQYIIGNKKITGPVNVTAPFPVRNYDFTQIMACVIRRPVIIPRIPKVILYIFMGRASSMLIEGQKVIPEKLLLSGFRFRYSHLPDALRQIIR